MRLDHPVFHTPLEAGVELEPLPADDRFADGYAAGTPTWLVQTGELGSGKGNDYGVVSDGFGLEDSPDCEWISGGINSKGPHAVAIAREANLLQWGFYAAPDRMTASARRAFLNALVYMRQFDGARPLVEKAARSRDWMTRHLAGVRRTAAEDASGSLRAYYLGQFPADVVARTGGDADRLAAWFDEVREFVRMDDNRQLVVDPLLRELRLSNRRPELLDWLVATLREDPDDPRALTLAARYLGAHGGDAATAIAWIETNRDRMFFSDVGGFRWFVDPRGRAR